MRRRNSIFIIFSLLLLMVCASFAQEAGVQFEQANQLYRTGEYQKAGQAYEQIIANGYEDAPLFYNLGNAYYKQKKYPEAIVNYERAKRLSPADEEIEHNLRLANLHVVDRIEPVPQLFIFEWWRTFINLFTTDVWAVIAIGLLWATVILGALMLLLRSDILRRFILFIAFVAFIASLVSFVGVFQRNSIESEQYAVVFSPSVSVKSAPDSQSTDLFVIHEGVKMQILDTVGEWKKIKLADGKIGWMPQQGMQEI